MRARVVVVGVGALLAMGLLMPGVASAQEEEEPTQSVESTESEAGPEPSTDPTDESEGTGDTSESSKTTSSEGKDEPAETAGSSEESSSDSSPSSESSSKVEESEPSAKAEGSLESETTTTNSADKETTTDQATTTKVEDGSCSTTLVESRQGPVPEDCERVERGDFEENTEGDLETQVTVDGVTLTLVITETEDGEVLEWTSSEPFFGTIEVKGGSGGSTICEGNGETSGTCSAPLNPSGKFADVSFVQVCPGVPPTNGNGPTQNGGPGPTPGGEVAGEAERGAAAPAQVAAVPAAAGAAAAGAAVEELPFTGLDTMWLLLLGGLLVGSGAILRVRLG